MRTLLKELLKQLTITTIIVLAEAISKQKNDRL